MVMSNREKGQNDSNIVYFPNLDTKLVKKGMASLQDKLFTEALSYFQQLLEVDSSHPQGNIGLVLSLIELGRLEEARQSCEEILKKGIGDYFQVIQIYISILIHLGDYDQVTTLIEAVIQEDGLPPQLAENFYQLLNFSRKMSDSKPTNIDSEPYPLEELSALSKMLDEDDSEKNRMAIQKLKHFEYHKVKPIYEKYLIDKAKDPILKSVILQQVKDKQIKDTLELHKFGRNYTINIEEMENIFDSSFHENVKKLLSRDLEQENPTLYEMTLHMWEHYLFAIFPLKPSPLNDSLWAAALYIVGHDLIGMEFNKEEVASRYNVTLIEMEAAVKKIKEIEARSKEG
jgi:tetratricopeptide (TPR) repeat protein